jgi:uncharacterized membrane protein YadS
MDFLAMGVLLLGAGLTVRLLAKNVMSRYKKIYITIVIVLFFLLWAELSVGLF